MHWEEGPRASVPTRLRQVVLEGVRDRLGAAADTELVQHGGDVVVDGMGADAEPFGDRVGARTVCEEVKHFALAGGEVDRRRLRMRFVAPPRREGVFGGGGDLAHEVLQTLDPVDAADDVGEGERPAGRIRDREDRDVHPQVVRGPHAEIEVAHVDASPRERPLLAARPAHLTAATVDAGDDLVARPAADLGGGVAEGGLRGGVPVHDRPAVVDDEDGVAARVDRAQQVGAEVQRALHDRLRPQRTPRGYLVPPTLDAVRLTLREALGLGDREVVAFVGAGGKTTALFRLARELRADGATVVVTTTTKILIPPASLDLDVVVEPQPSRLLAAVATALALGRIPVAARATTAEGKLEGVPPEWVADLAALPGVTHVLVEADGAARKPFTAPREGEPVIPASATVVVPVVGVDALGEPLSAAVAHRPERVTALTGLADGDRLEAWAIARVLLDPRGSAGSTPRGARIVHLVNKADSPQRVAAARELAAELRRAGAARVVIATLEAEHAVVEVSGDAARQARAADSSSGRPSRK